MLPDIFASEDVDLKKLLNAEDRDLIGRMKSILGPFILRRLKSDVMQQLVPKIQQVCPSLLVPILFFFCFYRLLPSSVSFQLFFTSCARKQITQEGDKDIFEIKSH